MSSRSQGQRLQSRVQSKEDILYRDLSRNLFSSLQRKDRVTSPISVCQGRSWLIEAGLRQAWKNGSSVSFPRKETCEIQPIKSPYDDGLYEISRATNWTNQKNRHESPYRKPRSKSFAKKENALGMRSLLITLSRVEWGMHTCARERRIPFTRARLLR